MVKSYPRLSICLLHSSISRERNVWTSTEKSCPQTSPSLAAPARSCTSPSTAVSARTSAAAYRTSPKPSTLSSSVQMGWDSHGRWCGSRPASATSAAKTPTTSLPTWRITTGSQKLSTSCHFCSQPVGTSCFSSDVFLWDVFGVWLCIRDILWHFFLLEKSVNMKCICVPRMDFLQQDVPLKKKKKWCAALQVQPYSSSQCEIWKA